MNSLLFIPPLLFTLGNLLDKKITNRIGLSSPLFVVAISGFFGLIFNLGVFILHGIYSISLAHLPFILISGLLSSLSVFLYIEALKSDSVLSVAPAMQLVPIFGYFADIILFDEKLVFSALVGCFLVIIGSLFLSVHTERVLGDDKFIWKTFGITAISALCLASSGVFFKYFAQIYDYWSVQFYEYVGIIISALFCLMVIRFKMKNESLKFSFTENGLLRFFLVFYLSTEIIMILADLSLNYVSLLAPLSYVYAVNSTQPLFLILLSIPVLYIDPKFDLDLKTKIFNKKNLISILLIMIGGVLASTRL